MALGASLLALAVALALAPAFNDAPVPVFLVAVLISAWAGGLGPGVVATLVAALALARLFNLSRASPLPGPADTTFDLFLFVVVAGLMSWLVSRLRLTNRRLTAAHAELEAAARGREDFLAAAAHDLKSPIAAIGMTAQLAKRRLQRSGEAQSSNEIALQLGQIETTARRMGMLVDELLEVAHVAAGHKPRLNLAPCPLLPIVEAAVAAHQVTNPAGHVIQLVAAAQPLGTWDAARLARVVDNLLSNAIKYSPAGGEITLQVDEEGREDGTCVAVLRVQDRGVGIPAAELHRVFERFFRAGNVGTIGGMGIGLAGAAAIAQQHGGTLTVESREGEGSTFTLRLPLDAANHVEASG